MAKKHVKKTTVVCIDEFEERFKNSKGWEMRSMVSQVVVNGMRDQGRKKLEDLEFNSERLRKWANANGFSGEISDALGSREDGGSPFFVPKGKPPAAKKKKSSPFTP